MWRLKYKHLFHGKVLAVVIPLVISAAAAFFGMFRAELEEKVPTFVMLFFGLLLAGFIVSGLVVHHLTPEEKEKIRCAEESEWTELDDEARGRLQVPFVDKTPYFSVLVMLGIFIVPALFNIRELLAPTLILIAVAAIVLAGLFFNIAQEAIWANVGNSAKMKLIHVDDYQAHTKFLSEAWGKYELRESYHYMVFYLRSGKYVVKCASDTEEYLPGTVAVVKYLGMLRIVPYAG